MQLSGMITGSLGYSLKREFLANALSLREVETYNYQVYSIDFNTTSPAVIQQQIQNQWLGYSGDVNVTVFSTEHGYTYPSDSIRSAKFNVTVEARKAPTSLSSFSELSGGIYSGLDSGFITTYGAFLTDFKEVFGFGVNNNGNREFSHDLSFGLKTGWGGDNSQSGRKTYAQTLANAILSKDKNLSFGMAVLSGQISTLADTTKTKNYYTESYDLLRNVYSFGRKRELLPLSSTSGYANITNSLNLNTDGTIDVSEKAMIQGAIAFADTKNTLDFYYTGAYGRCSGIYNQFYNTSVMLTDAQYSGLGGLSILVNSPIKTVKTYDAHSSTANYDVTFTNNPTVSGSVIMSQTIEFNIEPNDRIEATHTYDFTASKILNDNTVFNTLISNVTGATSGIVNTYYSAFSGAKNAFSKINQIKTVAEWPNKKTKGSVKFYYSNNPSYFVQTDNLTFSILDYSLEEKKPADMVSEFKIVNRPTNKSVMSYAYQTERGEIVVNMKAVLGKQSNFFLPDGVGSFDTFKHSTNGQQSFARYLKALYKLGGQLFLSKFNYPTMAFNWFLSDAKFVLDSEGVLNVSMTYTYTLKKRSG